LGIGQSAELLGGGLIRSGVALLEIQQMRLQALRIGAGQLHQTLHILLVWLWAGRGSGLLWLLRLITWCRGR
jgi:hypothetical protein